MWENETEQKQEERKIQLVVKRAKLRKKIIWIYFKFLLNLIKIIIIFKYLFNSLTSFYYE